MKIPFNKIHLSGQELGYIQQALTTGKLAGDGQFTEFCSEWLESRLGTPKALLTQSCTAALEMAAILADLKAKDEVIMPSYTFVSTANAFALRGAVPVFVDICPDTLNLDSKQVEGAITSRTKAIVPVHYAGVACAMSELMTIARQNDLIVIEDAAQAILSKYRGQHLGTIGAFGTLSFHETKNIVSGEGGALLVNKSQDGNRAEIIREKGTNRSQFNRGEVDKYTWMDLGSSYLPSEITAALLKAQLDHASEIIERRMNIWESYHNAFEQLERNGRLRRPIVPDQCEHNAHMYYLLLEDGEDRTAFRKRLHSLGIQALTHYVPLHSSPFGKRIGRANASGLPHTDDVSNRLIRLPLWVGMEPLQDYVIESTIDALQR